MTRMERPSERLSVWRGTATPFQSVPPLLCRARRAGQAFWRRRVTQSCHLPLVICHWSLEHFNFGCLRGGSPDPPRMPRFLSQEPPFRARWVRRPTAQRLSGVVAVDQQEVQKKVAAKKRGGPSAGGLQGDPQFETGRLYYSVCSADCQEEWSGFFENITGSVGISESAIILHVLAGFTAKGAVGACWLWVFARRVRSKSRLGDRPAAQIAIWRCRVNKAETGGSGRRWL